jgi:hypothetical protein
MSEFRQENRLLIFSGVFVAEFFAVRFSSAYRISTGWRSRQWGASSRGDFH